MNLKTKLLTQNIIVLISTIVVTVCAGLLYIFIFSLVNNIPQAGTAADTLVIVSKNNNVIYKSINFSDVQIKEIQMQLAMKKSNYTCNNNSYHIKTESFDNGGEKYDIIKLVPKIDIGIFYGSLFVFCAAVFIISFIIAAAVVQNQNTKDIINPVISLKKETEKITDGGSC